MNYVLMLVFCLVLLVPVYGQLSDKMGLNNRFHVDVDGNEFEVLATANFDIETLQYNKDGPTLRFYLTSGLENNLGELTIPKALAGGPLDVYLDGNIIPSRILGNDLIWFILVDFNGTGTHTLEIQASAPGIAHNATIDPVPGMPSDAGTDDTPNAASGQAYDADAGGGCLVATAVYGTETAIQVQKLRQIRDTVLDTKPGSAFMTGFNHIYYAFSPAIADLERQNEVFREAVRLAIMPLLFTLEIMHNAYSDTDVILYGTAVIAMNLAMYVGVPVTLARSFKK